MEARAVKKKRCPICKKSAELTTVDAKNPWAPFCSQKCKEIDLGKWALEQYRVPGETADHEPDTEEKEEEEKGKDGVD